MGEAWLTDIKLDPLTPDEDINCRGSLVLDWEFITSSENDVPKGSFKFEKIFKYLL